MDESTLQLVLLAIIVLVIIGAIAWRTGKFSLLVKGLGVEASVTGEGGTTQSRDEGRPTAADGEPAPPAIHQAMDRSPGGTQVAGSGNTVINAPISAARDVRDVTLGTGGADGDADAQRPAGAES